MSELNAVAREWDWSDHPDLASFEEMMSRCRWRGTIVYPNGRPTLFWCANTVPIVNYAVGVRIFNVVIDSSEKVEGITLRKRMTWYSEVQLFNVSVVLFPYEHQPPAPKASAAPVREGIPS